MLRYPRFRFRPGQADALHLDLWLGPDNLLRDGGTYSYNTDQQWIEYFTGTASHNTVQFDDRDQMPRLSRFLFGDWLKSEGVEPFQVDAEGTHFGAGYKDHHGARHHRRVCLQAAALTVRDEVEGFAQKAVLRWRLSPGDWRLAQSPQGLCLTQGAEGRVSLLVTADVPLIRSELVQGWESLHYLEKMPVPVLEIEVKQACVFNTEVLWSV